MNSSIQNIIDNVKTFESTKDALLLELVSENEENVISMNVDDQLFKGVNAKGETIKPFYRPSTVRKKIKTNKPYDRVTTRQEGDFHASFFLIYGSTEFEIDAKDQKKVFLEKRYSSDLYGLTEENLDRLTDLIRGQFIERAKKMITS